MFNKKHVTLIAPMLNKVAPVTTQATQNSTSGDELGLINGTTTYLNGRNKNEVKIRTSAHSKL